MEKAGRSYRSRRLFGLGRSRYHITCRDTGCFGSGNFTGSDKLTGSGDRSQRIRTALSGYQGDEQQARNSFGSSDASTRRLAIGALERLGCLEPSDLVTALEDPDPSVRRRAAEASAKVPEIDLRPLLADPISSVSEAAAFAIGEQMAVDSIELLIEMAAGHEDPLCRESAIAALGALTTLDHGDRDAILQCLLSAMTDRPQIRRRAVLGLFQFDEAIAHEALTSALSAKDRQVRAAVGDLLGVPVD